MTMLMVANPSRPPCTSSLLRAVIDVELQPRTTLNDLIPGSIILSRLLQRVRHEGKPTTVRRPAIDVDRSLPAEEREAPYDIPPICGAYHPHFRIQIGRVPKCA